MRESNPANGADSDFDDLESMFGEMDSDVAEKEKVVLTQ